MWTQPDAVVGDVHSFPAAMQGGGENAFLLPRLAVPMEAMCVSRLLSFKCQDVILPVKALR